MLYTTGFMAAGVLAAALTLSASSSAAHARAEEDAATAGPPPRGGEPLPAADVEALTALSSAVAVHPILRHQLTAPDPGLAAHARAAAERTTGPTRNALLTIAASAERSALAFLVDYSLAAGAWESATGIRMSSPLIVGVAHGAPLGDSRK